MTTKLFESMAVGKPLLCVKSDESCLEATIRNTRSGLAARTAEEAFRFILHHYQFWQDNGYTHINTDKEQWNVSPVKNKLNNLCVSLPD